MPPRSNPSTTYVSAARLYRFRDIIEISRTVPISMNKRYAPMIGT